MASDIFSTRVAAPLARIALAIGVSEVGPAALGCPAAALTKPAFLVGELIQ